MFMYDTNLLASKAAVTFLASQHSHLTLRIQALSLKRPHTWNMKHETRWQISAPMMDMEIVMLNSEWQIWESTDPEVDWYWGLTVQYYIYIWSLLYWPWWSYPKSFHRWPSCYSSECPCIYTKHDTDGRILHTSICKSNLQWKNVNTEYLCLYFP